MGLKDKAARNAYERAKWQRKRAEKLLAMGLNPAEHPVTTPQTRGQLLKRRKDGLPDEIRLRRPGETDDEYRKRYNRERIKHYNDRDRDAHNAKVRERYHRNHEQARKTVNAWVKDNKSKVAKAQSKYYFNNKEVRLENSRKWLKNNPERARARFKAWASKHPEVFLASSARCRAQILQAAPDWTDWKAIRKIYAKSANHNRDHPDHKWQVDHIIPLNNPHVCGLHVPWNLRIITATDNRKKGNRWNPEDGIAPMT